MSGKIMKNSMAVTLMAVLIISTIFSGYGVSNTASEDATTIGQVDSEQIPQSDEDEEVDDLSKGNLQNGLNSGSYDFYTSDGFYSDSQSSGWGFNDPHRIDMVHDMGYTGDGVKVALADTGVDFGHPDLNHSYYAVEDDSSPYYGWPMAFDPMSMNAFLSSASPEGTWYVDTSRTGYVPFSLPHTIEIDGLINDFYPPERIGSSGAGGLGENRDWDVNHLYAAIDDDDWYLGFNTYFGEVNKTYAFYFDETGPVSGGLTDPRGHFIDFESSHSDIINSMAYDSVNNRVYTGSRGITDLSTDRSSVRVWGEDGSLIDTLQEHASQVRSVSTSPDGTMFVSLDNQRCVVWDSETLEKITSFEYTASTINRNDVVSFSPNSTYIAIGGIGDNPNVVRLYDVDGNFIKEISAADPQDIEFNPVNGELLAVGLGDGSSRVLNITDGSTVATAPYTHDANVKIAWMPNGRDLLTAGDGNLDNIVYMWDTENETILHEYQLFSNAFIKEESLTHGNLVEGESDFSNTTESDGKLRIVDEVEHEGVPRLNVTYTLQFPSEERPTKNFNFKGRLSWGNASEKAFLYIYNFEENKWDLHWQLFDTDIFVQDTTEFDRNIYSDEQGRVLIRILDEDLDGDGSNGRLSIDYLYCSYGIRMSTIASSSDGQWISVSTEDGKIHILNDTLDRQEVIANPKDLESSHFAFTTANEVLSVTEDNAVRKWDVGSKEYDVFYQNKPDYVMYADYIRLIDEETGDLFRNPRLYSWNETTDDWDGPINLADHGGTFGYESQSVAETVQNGFAEIKVPRGLLNDADSLAIQMALVKTEENSRAIDATPKEANLVRYYGALGGENQASRTYALNDLEYSTLSNLVIRGMPYVSVSDSIGPGPYNFGAHPSETLKRKFGDIGVVVYEENVYVDLNHDYTIDENDVIMNKSYPIGAAEVDSTGDGNPDFSVSAGMLYFMSDAKEVIGEELTVDPDTNIAELEHENLVSFPDRVVVYKNGVLWDEVTSIKHFDQDTDQKLVPNIGDDDLEIVAEKMLVQNLTVFESRTGEEEGFKLPHHSIYSTGELVEEYTIHDLSLFFSPIMTKVDENNFTVDETTGVVTFSQQFLSEYPEDMVLNAFYNFTGKLLDDDYSYDPTSGDVAFEHTLHSDTNVKATYTYVPFAVDEKEGNITITGDFAAEDTLTADYQYDGLPVPYSEVLAEERGMEFIPAAGNNDMIALIGDFGWDRAKNEAKSHGTRIASSIASAGEMETDFGGKILGTAPNAKIIPIANADADLVNSWKFAVQGYDGVKDSDDDCQIVYTAPKLSTYETGFDTFSQNLNDISKNNPNTTFITGIGDDGYGYGTALSPTSSNAIVVGASTYGRENGDVWYMQIPSYSSRGPTSAGKMKPDLIAVGTGYVHLPLGIRKTPHSSNPWSTTELSAGIVTGIAALVYESYENTTGEFPYGNETRQIMLSSSKDMGYDVFTQGSGFIDALDAVRLSTGGSGLLLSKNIWEPGDYQGTVYDSFPNIVEPGKTYTENITLSSMGDTEEVHIVSNSFNKIGEDSWQFSTNVNNPYTDIVTDMIPYNASLLRVTVSAPSWATLSTEDPSVLTINDWHDDDSSGTVGGGESVTINECSLISSTLQVSISDPLVGIEDGLVVRLDPSHSNWFGYEITMEYFAYSEMEWISMNNIDSISDQEQLELSMEIPEDVQPGTYDSSVIVNHDINSQSEIEIFNVTKNKVENEIHDGVIETVENDAVFMEEGSTTGRTSHDNITWFDSYNTQVNNETHNESDLFSHDGGLAYYLDYNDSYGAFDNVSVSRIDAYDIDYGWFELYPAFEASGLVDVDEEEGLIWLDINDPSDWNIDGRTRNWYNTSFEHYLSIDRYMGEFELEQSVPTDSIINFTYSYLPGGRFELGHDKIVEGNLTFYLNASVVPESNYTVDWANGYVYLTEPLIEIHPDSSINFTYSYIEEYFDEKKTQIPASKYNPPYYYKEGTLVVTKYPWHGGEEEILVEDTDYVFYRASGVINLTDELHADDVLSVSYDYYNRSRVIPIVAHVAAFGAENTLQDQDMNTPFNSGGLMGGSGGNTKKSGDWRYYYVDIPKQGRFASPEETLKLIVDGDWSDFEQQAPEGISKTEKTTHPENLLEENNTDAMIEGDGFVTLDGFYPPTGRIRDIRVGIKFRSDTAIETDIKKRDKMILTLMIGDEDVDKNLEIVPDTEYQTSYIDITDELDHVRNITELQVNIEHDQYATWDGWNLLVDHVWLEFTKSNAPTDMDIHVLTESTTAIGGEGPYTIGYQVGSEEDSYFLTNTGQSQEILAMTLASGLNVIAVHNTLLNKTSRQNIDVNIGTLELSSSKLETHTNQLSGNAEIGLRWNTEMHGYGGEVVGPGSEEFYPDQEVYNDDTSGITNFYKAMVERASYTKVVTLENVLSWDVHVLQQDSTPDLDLAICYDFDGTGIPTFEKLVTPEHTEYVSHDAYGTGPFASSADGSLIDERVTLYNPPDGDYIIVVYGYTVNEEPGTFDLKLTSIMAGVAGYELRGYHKDISENEPSRYITRTHSEPHHQNTMNVTWSFAEGTTDGEYGGVLKVGPKEVPDLISIPVSVYLDTEAPKLKDSMPSSGTRTDSHHPFIGLSYSDTSGVDSKKSKVYLNGEDITNLVDFGDDDFSYRPEKSLPEGLYHVDVNFTDIANNTARKSWSFYIDSTAPVIDLDSPFTDGRKLVYTPEEHIVISGSLDYDVVELQAGVESDVEIYSRQISFKDQKFRYTQELPEEGQYIVTLTATDWAGNQRTVPLTIFRTLTGATVNIDRPLITQQYTRKNELIVSGKVEKTVEHGKVDVWVNNVKRQVMADGTFDHTLILSEGENDIVVKVSDEAGNLFWRNRTIIKDSIAPEVTWDHELDGNKVTISGEVNEDNSRVFINGRSVRLTNNGFDEEIDYLRADSMNEISIVVEDAAGNIVESKRYIDLGAETTDDSMMMLFAAIAMVLFVLIGLLVGYKAMPKVFGSGEPTGTEYTPGSEKELEDDIYEEPDELEESSEEEEFDEEFEEGEIEPEPEDEIEDDILDEFEEPEEFDDEELDEDIVEDLVGEPEEELDEENIVDDIFG